MANDGAQSLDAKFQDTTQRIRLSKSSNHSWKWTRYMAGTCLIITLKEEERSTGCGISWMASIKSYVRIGYSSRPNVQGCLSITLGVDDEAAQETLMMWSVSKLNAVLRLNLNCCLLSFSPHNGLVRFPRRLSQMHFAKKSFAPGRLSR
jgi:hypothetical protein